MDFGDGRLYSKSGHDVTPLGDDRVAELAQNLDPAAREVLLEQATERPFCGALLDNKEPGSYTCRLCGLPVFRSAAKFDSGSGWPSFFRPFDPAHIASVQDESLGMVRAEIRCGRCGSHLGHVFEDGPKPTGLRYCVNSAALEFHREGDGLPPESRPIETETAYFAGGCFWGVEDRFQNLAGVIAAVSGYQGGDTENPSYKQVCSGTTGHAESVRVTYDPSRVTYRRLLEAFFEFHDPTQLNRQGPDVGTQYRSAVFADNESQLAQARAFVEEMQASPRFDGRPIVTQVRPTAPFHEAEEHHQDYHAKHGGSCALP